uniref:Uncharacterized protein n=1 Tax=Gasterosteus aculeatus aculeatus TaxID=481459 RepID=A0AAQ4PV72_GASAC
PVQGGGSTCFVSLCVSLSFFLCRHFVSICSHVMSIFTLCLFVVILCLFVVILSVCSHFVSLCSHFMSLCSYFMSLCSHFMSLCSHFVVPRPGGLLDSPQRDSGGFPAPSWSKVSVNLHIQEVGLQVFLKQ